MFSDKAPKNDSKSLFLEEVRDYIRLQGSYIRLEFVDKLSMIISVLMTFVLVVVFLSCFFFYLSFGLLYLMAENFGTMLPGALIIGGIYLLLVVLVFCFRKKLILNPLIKILASVIYEDNKKMK